MAKFAGIRYEIVGCDTIVYQVMILSGKKVGGKKVGGKR